MSKFRHPIYGTKPRVVIRPAAQTVSSAPYCYQPCPGIDDAFISLEEMIFNLERALQQYYQPQRVVSEFIAQMSARCYVPPAILVRLAWREAHPGVRFEITDRIQRLQIKFIYIQFGYDYTDDPLFKDALGLTLI
jgi:hypothetical protein